MRLRPTYTAVLIRNEGILKKEVSAAGVCSEKWSRMFSLHHGDTSFWNFSSDLPGSHRYGFAFELGRSKQSLLFRACIKLLSDGDVANSHIILCPCHLSVWTLDTRSPT
jgi:hypothetical protein